MSRLEKLYKKACWPECLSPVPKARGYPSRSGDMGICYYLAVHFLLQRAELSVSAFRICAGLWLPFEERCRIVGTISEKCGKSCKSCLKILLRFQELLSHSLALRKYGHSFHHFYGIMGCIFPDMAGIMGSKFGPTWHISFES